MTLPPLTGLTPDDIAEFDQLLDQMPHGYAKHLSAWLNDKIIVQHERDRQNAAELEAMCRRLDAEQQVADTPAARIDAYVDQIAESCVSPPTPETKLH